MVEIVRLEENKDLMRMYQQDLPDDRLDKNSILQMFEGGSNYWYLARLDYNELLHLCVVSSLREASPFPLIKDSLKEILDDPDVLKIKRKRGEGQNPSKVKELVEDLEKGIDILRIKPIITDQKDERFPKNRSYYIRDGAHRLTAYAYYQCINKSYSPATVYLRSSKRID